MSEDSNQSRHALIDWRMLPMGLLSLAIGAVVTISIGSNIGFTSVPLEHLPQTVKELAKLKLPTPNATKQNEILAEIRRSNGVAKPVETVSAPTPAKAPSPENSPVATAESKPVAIEPTAVTPTAVQDTEEVINSVSSHEEIIVTPETDQVIALANEASGVTPIEVVRPGLESEEEFPDLPSVEEIDAGRYSTDPNALPILRVEIPKTGKPRITSENSDADASDVIATTEATLSKTVVDAVDSGVVEHVLDLLAKGDPVDGVDSAGQTLILKAAWNGDEEMFDALLTKNADISIESADGRTPLYSAAVSGNISMVRKLVEKGARVNNRTIEGKTPLMVCAWSNYPQIARYLLEKGADPDTIDNNGRNALFYALWDRNIDVVRILVEYGARLDQTDIEGHTAFDIARLRRIELPGMRLDAESDRKN